MFLLPPFLKEFFGKKQREAQPRVYLQDEQLAVRVKKIAAEQSRMEQEVYADIFEAGLKVIQDSDAHAGTWNSLSQREQQVTALTCLGYRSYEIADMLGVSYETVRTHSKHVYAKFGLNRKQLRQALQDWDFQEWLKIPRT